MIVLQDACHHFFFDDNDNISDICIYCGCMFQQALENQAEMIRQEIAINSPGLTSMIQ